MRFLVVYQDFSRPAQQLVDNLGVQDVTVLLVRKGERAPSPEFLAPLEKHPHAPAAVCQVVRKFKKSIEALVDIQYIAKKFRSDDQLLTAWLRPPETREEPLFAPSAAMTNATSGARHLLLADGALEHADEIAKHRWKFANLAANLLARYAQREELGALRKWKQDYGVDFAANGGVRYDYILVANGNEHHGSTEWHLKEGDNTTRESAARIYFDRAEIGGVVKVCVFYLGPHPDNGKYFVRIECSEN